MNQEKAKEFFSPYYEGSLDAGLAQQLEAALGRDASLRADFKQFEQTYEDLGSLKFETIEIPFDLNERIAARIDRHVYEQRTSRQPIWTLWMRNVAIAGVSAVAILGAALSLRRAQGPTSTANLVPVGTSPQDEISIEPSGSGATLRFKPAEPQVLIIRQGLKGPERRRVSVDESGLSTSLENPNPSSTVFEVDVQSDPRPALIALPGTQGARSRTGEGNLETFAKAMADFYRIPVEIHVSKPNVNVAWKFDSIDPQEAAASTLSAQRYSIDRRTNGLLVIADP